MSMDRRTFLRSGMAAGTLLSVAGSGCTSEAPVGSSGPEDHSSGVRPFELDEITIGLSDKYAPGTSLEDLIQGAGRTAIGCDGGIVDPAGLQ